MDRRRAGNWAFRGALLALAGCLSWFLLVALLVPLPPVAGYEAVVVTGGSMGEAVPAGSVAIVRDADPAVLQPGDVVMYRTDAGVRVTHRIVARTESAMGPVFTTHGDANAAPDPNPVPAAAVEGQVVRAIAFAGFVSMFIASPTMFLFLAGAGLIALCGLPRLHRRHAASPEGSRP